MRSTVSLHHVIKQVFIHGAAAPVLTRLLLLMLCCICPTQNALDELMRPHDVVTAGITGRRAANRALRLKQQACGVIFCSTGAVPSW
jgi:hypothetical protein